MNDTKFSNVGAHVFSHGCVQSSPYTHALDQHYNTSASCKPSSFLFSALGPPERGILCNKRNYAEYGAEIHQVVLFVDRRVCRSPECTDFSEGRSRMF